MKLPECVLQPATPSRRTPWPAGRWWTQSPPSLGLCRDSGARWGCNLTVGRWKHESNNLSSCLIRWSCRGQVSAWSSAAAASPGSRGRTRDTWRMWRRSLTPAFWPSSAVWQHWFASFTLLRGSEKWNKYLVLKYAWIKSKDDFGIIWVDGRILLGGMNTNGYLISGQARAERLLTKIFEK